MCVTPASKVQTNATGWFSDLCSYFELKIYRLPPSWDGCQKPPARGCLRSALPGPGVSGWEGGTDHTGCVCRAQREA